MKFRVFLFYAAAFLAIAAIVSLIVLYSGSVTREDEAGPLGDEFVAARVDGAEITGADINRELTVGGSSLPEGAAELRKRQEEVLELLIQLQLLKNEAAKRGIEVAESDLQSRLEQYLSQGRETFNAFLDDNHLTEEEFRERLREDMLIAQLGNEVRTELVDQINISDEDIEAYYKENLRQFDISEVAYVYIRIPPPGGEEEIESARDKANEAISKLKDGASFSQIARQYSDDARTKDSGGLLGPLNGGMLSTTLINAARQLQAGEFTSEPIQVQDGFNIIKRINEQYLPLEDVREEIRQILLQRRVESAFEKWLADVRTKANIQVYL